MTTVGSAEKWKRNKRLYIASVLLCTTGYGLVTTDYVQAFFISAGAGASLISLYGFAMNLSAMIGYVLFAVIGGTPRKCLSRIVLMSCLFALFPLMLAIPGIFGAGLVVLSVCALAAAALCGFGEAGRTTCENGAMGLLLPPRSYADLAALGGILGSAVTVLVGAITGLIGDLGAGYSLLFALASAMFFAQAFTQSRYRSIGEVGDGGQAERTQLLDSLKRLSELRTLSLMLPHAMRGVGMAGLYYCVFVASARIDFTGSNSSLLVAVGALGYVLGNFLFMRLSRRLATGKILLAATLTCAVCMALIPLCGSAPLFFVIYFVTRTADMITQVGVPVGVIRSTPIEDMPFISSVRMLAANGVQMLALLVFGKLFDFMPSICVMLISGALFVFGGLLFARRYTDSVDG